MPIVIVPNSIFLDLHISKNTKKTHLIYVILRKKTLRIGITVTSTQKKVYLKNN